MDLIILGHSSTFIIFLGILLFVSLNWLFSDYLQKWGVFWSKEIQIKPRLGQYRCTCGRRWESRCAWKKTYQICTRCQSHVFPHELRELLPSDLTKPLDKDQEHKKELCQRCIQFGRHCSRGYMKPRAQNHQLRRPY